MIALTALAAASPAHTIGQDRARALGRAVFAGRQDAFARMGEVYGNAGVLERQSCVPIDWYGVEHGWGDRNRLYVDHALALLRESASRCLAEGGLSPGDVDSLVVVSSTGIATPGLCARLMDHLPFRQDVERLPVFGLGCAGGVLGLARAAALARARPGATVLLLVVELCGLTFRRADTSKSNIIATALFGDGACAALIRNVDEAEGEKLRPLASIGPAGEHRWPDSLDIMGWSIEEDGLGVIFSRDIPALVRRDLRAAADRFLGRHGLDTADLAGVVCHPGGAKVLQALAEVFALNDEALEGEWAVLSRHGNMSAPTVLFVLAEKIARGARGRHLMTALGPGFTAGFCVLDL
ncbi:MAG: type III polyketide synthase [Alphaproteobacteria bacterium]|jgi:alkylresorcinol/alkylpyrone synthase|nr:type III polyketide synthase [Alphaproteobacteria bacterium]